MKAKVIENANVLIPNQEHRNFTESADVIEKGRIVFGEPKNIEGLRRGKPFTYRLFLINKTNKLIYINKINPMENVEVNLGSDESLSTTKITLPPTSKTQRTKMICIAVGAIAGFAYSKHKGVCAKSAIIYTLTGAAAGFVVGKVIESRNNKISIKK
jgi:hypothetical protein